MNIKEIVRRYGIVILTSSAIVICLLGFFLWQNTTNAVPIDEEIELFSLIQEEESVQETVEEESSIYVDIKGAVANPGIYEANSQMRVNDIINMAGGFLDIAQTKAVNLAKRVQDQMVIYVPMIDEEMPNEVATTPVQATSQGKVNINTATAEELQTLSGIGSKRAQDIINYRVEHGSFQSVEELQNVSGIGERTMENLRDFVVVR